MSIKYALIVLVVLISITGCASQEKIEPETEISAEPVKEVPVEEAPVEEVIEQESLALRNSIKSTVHNRGAEGLAIYDSTVVSGSWNDNIALSSLSTGKTIKLIKNAHKSDIVDIEFAINGAFFISLGLDRTIKIWDTKNASLIKSIGPLPVNAIDVSISTGINPYIAVAALNGMVYIYEYESAKRISQFKASTLYSTAVQFIDKYRIAGAGADGYVHIWDIELVKELFQFRAHDQRINVLRLNADGTLLASAGWDKTIKVWDTQDFSQVASLAFQDQGVLESLEFSPDSYFLLGGDRKGSITIWDIKEQSVHAVETTDVKRVYDIRFNAVGDKAVITGYDTTVRFYSVE